LGKVEITPFAQELRHDSLALAPNGRDEKRATVGREWHRIAIGAVFRHQSPRLARLLRVLPCA
jgi:hypothetical protein